MQLEADKLRRYARQITLPEIGESGQLRLARLSLQPPPEADALSLGWATRYLRRAGVNAEDAPENIPLLVPEQSEVMRIANSREAYAVTALLVGSFAAVEALKAALEVGRPGNLPQTTGSGDMP